MLPPRKKTDGGDHLTIRIGSKFEATANGKLSIAILGIVVLLVVLSPTIIAHLWT